MESYVCTRCDRALPPESFPPSRIRVRQYTCRQCISDDNRRHYATNRAYIDAVKLEAGCADCGYRAAAIALDFDHLPGFEKIERIAALAGCASLDRIKREIAKCEVVCANCHRLRTEARGHQAAWWEGWRAGEYDNVTPIDDGRMRLFDEHGEALG